MQPFGRGRVSFLAPTEPVSACTQRLAAGSADEAKKEPSPSGVTEADLQQAAPAVAEPDAAAAAAAAAVVQADAENDNASRANIFRIAFGLGYAALFYSVATAESNPLYQSKVRDVAIGGAVPRAGLKVLEVGIGNAPNLDYYPTGTTLVGLDAGLPDRESRMGVEARARQRGVKMYWVRGDVEKLPFESGAFDAVVTTKVLCSVANPIAALREISRVLAPGGRFGYVEHVAAEKGSLLEGQQLFLDPYQQAIAGNCHLHRDTDDLIRRSVRGQPDAGDVLFDHLDVAERYQVWEMWPITQQAAGVVTK